MTSEHHIFLVISNHDVFLTQGILHFGELWLCDAALQFLQNRDGNPPEASSDRQVCMCIVATLFKPGSFKEMNFDALKKLFLRSQAPWHCEFSPIHEMIAYDEILMRCSRSQILQKQFVPVGVPCNNNIWRDTKHRSLIAGILYSLTWLLFLA